MFGNIRTGQESTMPAVGAPIDESRSRPHARAATAGLALALALACAGRQAPAGPPLSTPAARRAALEEAGLHGSTVPAPLGPLRYFSGGRGPTVVLVHGSGGQAGDWYRIVPALARRFSLLIPDLPGHGESGPSSGPLAVGDLAGALGALLAAERPREPVALVGNSLGGWVSLLYASEHPERVARVVGISSSGIFAPLPVPLVPHDREEARRLLLAVRGPSVPSPSDADLDAVIAAIAAGPASRLVAGLRAGDFLEGRAASLRVPVDLVWGEEDGLLVPDYGRRLAGLLPDARFHLLARCGHMPQVWCPGTLTPVLLEILGSDRAPRR
jgi:4,5:9,10-diseco-3-hydroxy-5,9,17-trioxoandrosta-1(10),2-diene-4-oate hydrolase